MDEIVGSDTIQDLSKRIGHSWKVLGGHLGIKDVILDSIEADSNSNQESSYHMLLSWKQRNGNSATYRRLSNDLMKVGRKDLSDMIEAGLSGTAMDSSKGTTLTPKRSESELRWRWESSVVVPLRPPSPEPSEWPTRWPKDVLPAGSSSESASSSNIPRLDHPVDDETLRNLPRQIGWEWKHVGRYLGLAESELHNIEVDNRNDFRQAIHSMFSSWKQRNGRGATFRVLGMALDKAGRRDLVDFVYERAFTAPALFAPSQDFEEEAELSPEMTENAESDILQSYNKLQETVTALLTQSDCEQLLDYFKLSKEHYEVTQTSDSSSKFLLDILEERGFIHPADVSALLEALRELKINDRVLHIVEAYDRSKDDETSFETFLAALSAHLTLSIPEKLCDYFKFTDEEKEAVISSKSPGLELTMALERKGYINPYDVGRLLPALRELRLMQAAAKVEEYQILVEERSDFKTPAKTLKEKESLFIKCVKAKIKSWCEGMTPIPWKKSCQWKVSDLFVTRGLTLANKRMETKSSPTKPLNYTDIFTHQDLQDESRLIMEGDPGSGKTMLAFQLAYDWSIGNLNGVNMVMILPLKFLQDMTITEAIAKFYLPKDAPLGEDDIKAILNSANERNKTCIVLDGIEEYNHKPEDGQASAVDTVMNEDQLSNCTVLLTSRSDFERGFGQFPKLKLGPFGEKERGLYIDRIVPEDKERQQKLKVAIQSSDFLRDICSNALLFAFVIHNIEPLLEGDIKDHLERVGPFMQLMVDNLLSATKSAQSKKDTQGMEHSDKLAEIAFNGLCKGQQILMWQKSFLEKKVPNLKMWIESGILVEEENILMRGGGKEIKVQEKEIEEEMPGSQATDQLEQKAEVQLQHDHKRRDQELEGGQDSGQSASSVSDPRKVSLLVKFLHKVIQEWFAAEHFSSVLKHKILENCHQDFIHRHLRMINPADLHYVLRFTSYLCPFSGHCIMQGLHKIYKKKDGAIQESASNCIALCFAEFDSSMEDDNIHNAVRQVVRNAVTIRGEDNRLLQRSKVSMLEYGASNSKQIKIRCLRLVDVLNKVAQGQVTLNSGIILPWLSNLEAVSVCQWAQKLDEVDCRNLLAFITNCSGLKEAILEVSNPPPDIKDETTISEIKLRNMKITWTIGSFSQAWDMNTNKWRFLPVQQTHAAIDDFKAESGSEDESSESSDKEVKSGRNQKEELRPLKKSYVAVDEEKQQLSIELQRATEELDNTKSSLRDAEERLAKCKQQYFSEVTSLQGDLEKTRKILNDKENGNILQKYRQLQGNITGLLTQSDCEQLGDYFQLPKEQVEAIQNSGSSSNVFVDVLEKSGLIHPADISKLLAALRALNINDTALQMLQDYTEFKDQLCFLPLRTEDVVTTEGGTLMIPNTGVHLEIPPNALENECMIQMRIISHHFANESQLLFSRNSAAVVELLPNNLKLLKPVKLTVPHCLVLKEGSQRKAKIYSSHHQQGTQPSWEEVHNPRYELRDHDCDIWLQHFSWETYVVDDQCVLGKELILYAAKCFPSRSKNALIDVGYYYALPGEKPLTLNKATELRSLPIVFYKEPEHNLEFTLEEVDPPTFTCTTKTKSISFGLVTTVKCSVCTFKLKRNPDAVTEEFTCTFSAAQQPRTYELMFDVVPQIIDKKPPDMSQFWSTLLIVSVPVAFSAIALRYWLRA